MEETTISCRLSAKFTKSRIKKIANAAGTVMSELGRVFRSKIRAHRRKYPFLQDSSYPG